MPEQRHVYRVGTSTVVALPPRVREHLAVKRGDAVYWHVTRGKEVVLSPLAQREGGRPEGLALERKLRAALAEIARLHASAAARERTLYAEGHTAGYRLAVDRYENPTSPSVVRALARRIRHDTTPSRSARRKAARARARQVDVIPTPVLAPPIEVTDGGDAASGAAPPGRP
jgi:antitoxin component of MazEF toxin-antitoxin module